MTKFIADFHIHSHYSLATSKKLVPEYLDYWARLKGIRVVGTGDFTHPGWTGELKEKLEPAEQGLFKLKAEYKKDKTLHTPFLSQARGLNVEDSHQADQSIRFMLTAEISCIYKKKGKVRKVHNVVFAPDFETAEKIQQRLIDIGGNITSDGRPILGLDSRDLLEIALECSQDIFFVPAHIWTPWFSILGSKSGFDSVEECYDDLAEHIYAVETGLSTDPPMHWMCSFLDKYTLISNSDAHSPEKLGRNANCFNTELSYNAITGALKSGDPAQFNGTIDLFPQEGKYHYDGHRKCGIRWNPVQTLKHNGLCPGCGKAVTVGVMSRVVQLSDREDLGLRKNRADFHSIIPLKELLSEIEGVGPNSKRIAGRYMEILKAGRSELELLLKTPLEALAEIGGPGLAEAVRRMRLREVKVKEGFDGEYGVITVFQKNERPAEESPGLLFTELAQKNPLKRERRKLLNFDLEEYRQLERMKAGPIGANAEKNNKGSENRENENKKYENKGSENKGSENKGSENKGSGNGAGTGLNADLNADGRTKEHDGDGGGEWLLNPEQEAAVHHFAGPALVIAGPGTGKTRVLTYRISHLIHKKEVKAENILAVTFTNKAAGEIKERLEQLLGNERLPTVNTFHALGYSILRETGANDNLTIIDEEDKKRILLKCRGVEKKNLKKLIEAIGVAKQQVTVTEQLVSKSISNSDKITSPSEPGENSCRQSADFSVPGDSRGKCRDLEENEFLRVFREYNDILNRFDAVDLEDLIYRPVCLFSNDEELLRRYRERYRWILVDEYQDVNYGQYRLIRLLAPGNANLCVIGDPDQAIYGFRGADVRFIGAFKEDYPNAALYRLKKSFRCSDSILKASGNVIGVREGVGEKVLRGVDKGVKINICKNASPKSEAEFVARTIEDKMGGLRFFSMDSDITMGNKDAEIESLEDFVVLCRVRSQMEAMEKAFNDHAIPYQVVGETPFFRQEPIQTVVDILKLYRHPENPFLRERLLEKGPMGAEELDNTVSALTTEDRELKEVLMGIVDSFLQAERGENESLFKRLYQLAGPYRGARGLQEFLEFVSLGTSADTYRPGLENVAVMTLHAAKGLEFKCVFIVGCEEGILPYNVYRYLETDADEERRLLYVGMTRARKYLFLSHAEKRFLNGREYKLPRSSFLEKIEKELIELSRQKPGKKEVPKEVQRSLFP
ncbi:MAG: UvrD-helicase domain-containing protein [bacterium]|nr:UvrD-helicase domain-containing protein [bacterium]